MRFVSLIAIGKTMEQDKIVPQQHILCNRRAQYHVGKIEPLLPILNRMI